MESRTVAPGVSLFGSSESPSGFSVATEITHETHAGKAWPYLRVAISGNEGTRVYQSGLYAAWFAVRLCWDEADRLWIVAEDTGTDVIASSPQGWTRSRWMPDGNAETVLDAESGDRLAVVTWEAPAQMRECVGK